MIPKISSQFIETLKKEFTEYLYQLDPTQVGTVENELFDEYENEAAMIIDVTFTELNKSLTDDFQLEDLNMIVYYTIKSIFESQYKPFDVFDLFSPEEMKNTVFFLSDKIWQEI